MIKNENLNRINDASIEMLETIGMEFVSPEAKKVLREHGVKIENDRAFFTRDQIMEYMAKCPSEFKLCARNPEYDMNLNQEDVYYVPGYGCPKIREYDGTVRDAMLDDYLKLVEIVHSSQQYKCNGGILVQPADVEARFSQLIMMYSTITKSDKCILSVNGSAKRIEELAGLMSILFGGVEKLKEKPRFATIVNSLSPLKIDESAEGCLRTCVKYNQPLLVVPAPMAGGTGPISLAGNIALAHAEALAIIVYAQMLNPGNPVIYGSAAMTTDMKTGKAAIGSSGYALQSAYASRLAKMYKLPCRASGALTDAYGATIQAGYESMLSLFSAVEEKINFIIHTGGIVDAFGCCSIEKFIADIEMTRLIDYYNKDLEVNDKTLALDVVKEALKTGTFLTLKHTAKRCRKDPWQPTISLRGKLKLDEDTNIVMKKSIDAEMNRLLSNYKKPELSEDVAKELRKYMEDLGVDSKILDKIDNYNAELAVN